MIAKLGRQLSRATVGWRLMVAGPEADVLTVSAEALRDGALPAEIRAHATAIGRRRVQCVHRGGLADIDAAPGGTATLLPRPPRWPAGEHDVSTGSLQLV